MNTKDQDCFLSGGSPAQEFAQTLATPTALIVNGGAKPVELLRDRYGVYGIGVSEATGRSG
jgi:hypothetical protein